MIEIALGLGILVMVVAYGPAAWQRLRRRRLQQLRAQPNADPFANQVTPAQRARLEAVVKLLQGQEAPRASPAADPWGALHRGEDAMAAAHAFAASLVPRHRVGLVAVALHLCEVPAWGWHWRAGLRAVAVHAEGLPGAPGGAYDPGDHEAIAVVAQLEAALGHVAAATARVAEVPADHWRACLVRAICYDAVGDRERAESALVAAATLAPEMARPALRAQLEGLREA